MKPIKVFYNGKRLRDVYPHATRLQVLKWRIRRFFRKVFILGGIAAALSLTIFVSVKAGAYYNPREIVKETPKTIPAVLKRIAKCESPTGHFAKNGQVALYANKNGSSDIGKYMINGRIWGAQATKMNKNLMVEEDNEAFALWIYETHGTEPWFNTKSCWNK